MQAKLPRLVRKMLGAFHRHDRAFSSKDYWKNRYSGGGNSGPGSYEHLAAFKSEILNAFIAKYDVSSVIEFGCGDGNQLRYADYPEYVGYDVSCTAIDSCRRAFSGDASKQFWLVEHYDGRTADLAISLDVIFHLVEDDIFDGYMRRLFDASRHFVAIYSSNSDGNSMVTATHVRHRCFTRWIEAHRASWTLIEKIDNRFQYDGDYKRTSFSDFYFFEKR
jgi:hypothetical protein